MAEILDDSGYVTAAFTGSGSISAQFGFYRGFDSYNETSRPETGSDIDGILAKSIPWLQNHADRSFFLFLHTYEPHEPYNDDFFVTKEAIEETDSIAYSTAKYDGDIRRADWFLGEIVGALRGLGLLEKTILVVTSDHGEDLDRRAAPGAPSPAHGHTLYDELLRVPLIFFGPGIPAGNRIEFQVRSIDILPTVLDLVGLRTRADFEGASLRGMLEGKDREPRPAYSEATTYGTERESLRADGYKYIHRISYGQLADPMSWGLPLTPRHELYDLENDSEERTNTSDDNPLKVQEFQDLMRTINPRRTGEGQDPGSSPDSIDLTQDSELMDELRSLGYIQ